MVVAQVGGHADGVETQLPAGVEGAGQVEALRDEDGTVDLEDVARAVAGVVGAPPALVWLEGLTRHAALDGVLHHVKGLVVLLGLVVAAEQQALDFARFVQANGRFHAVA